MIVFKITFLFELAVLFSQIAFSQADTMITRKETITMKHFSLLVRVPETYNSEKAKLVNPQWDKLVEEWKDTGVYVLSFAFPGESYTVSGAKKEVRKEIVLANNLKVVSNVVIQAEDMEHALELAKSIPVLAYGGSVEVREIPKKLVSSEAM